MEEYAGVFNGIFAAWFQNKKKYACQSFFILNQTLALSFPRYLRIKINGVKEGAPFIGRKWGQCNVFVL